MIENFDFQSLGETGSVVVAFLFVAWKIADMWFKYVERAEKSRNEMLTRIGEQCHQHQKEQNALLLDTTNKVTTALDENTKILTRLRETDIRNIVTVSVQEAVSAVTQNKSQQ